MTGASVLQAVATVLGLVATGVVGLLSGRASARAAVATARISAEVAAEQNDSDAAAAVVAGAIALSQGVRNELDAVRRDLDAERTATRELRARMIERIESLEAQHDEDARRISALELDNDRLRRALAEVIRERERDAGTRTRASDPPLDPRDR